jgi:hypothetical protein
MRFTNFGLWLKSEDVKMRKIDIYWASVDDAFGEICFLSILQKLLHSLGASKVSAFATHGVFPKRSWERFAHNGNGEYLILMPVPMVSVFC